MAIFPRNLLKGGNYSREETICGNTVYDIMNLRQFYGAKYLVIVSSRSLKMREFSFAQFDNFLRKMYLFLNNKIHNYVLLNIIVNFIIQKLKNKLIFLKKLSI